MGEEPNQPRYVVRIMESSLNQTSQYQQKNTTTFNGFRSSAANEL
jgi:hypothetical protein